MGLSKRLFRYTCQGSPCLFGRLSSFYDETAKIVIPRHCGKKKVMTMQRPYQGPALGSAMPPPPSTIQPFDKFLETWWVAVTGRLRQYSVYLSETWADGIYLTAWPKVAALAPPVLLFVGLLEGIFHWSLLINDTIPSPGEISLTFTQLLPLMVLVAAVSALSTNFGLVLVLGYALGDFLIAGFHFTYAAGARGGLSAFSTLDPIQSFLYLHVAQLISYVLFLLLVITPTLSAKYLVPRLRGLTELASTQLKAGILMIIQGTIVYSWTLSAPLLIRVFWAWTDDQPPLSAAYYLQEQGGWVVVVAVLGVAVREWLSYQTRRNPVVTERIARQASALRVADTRPAFSRQLPSYIRAILAATLSTLLISGFIPSLFWGVILFLFLAFILVARMTLLPSLAIWQQWVGLIAHIPVLVRLAAGAFISYILAQVIISFYWNQPMMDPRESFVPVLIGVGLSLLVMTALVPPPSQLVATPPPARPPVPPFYGPPLPPPPMSWSVPPAQSAPPVCPMPPAQPTPPVYPMPTTWQGPHTQPPPPPQIPPAWPT